jgi:ubiquinone/menaquinone biosynthesis C-methylase UbiE
MGVTMHGLSHGHRNLPRVFEGRSSRFYDRTARWLLRGMYRRFAADVARAAAPGAQVLDVGTGPGVLLVELARRRGDLRLTGLDLSADMIAAARRNLAPFGDRVSTQVGDVTNLPFPDQSFDLIVSSLSLHHWDQPEAGAAELARVLRPDGRVHIYDFGFAPFDALGTVLNGRSAQRSRIGTGIAFLRCVRYVISA